MNAKGLIFWRVGKDTGFFRDLKTLKGATARLWRTFPNAKQVEVQFGRPVGSGLSVEVS